MENGGYKGSLSAVGVIGLNFFRKVLYTQQHVRHHLNLGYKLTHSLLCGSGSVSDRGWVLRWGWWRFIGALLVLYCNTWGTCMWKEALGLVHHLWRGLKSGCSLIPRYSPHKHSPSPHGARLLTGPPSHPLFLSPSPHGGRGPGAPPAAGRRRAGHRVPSPL